MEKLFTVAGTSRRNGTVKFRFSNDMKGRIPMLERTGHTEINLVELPTAMTKEAAIAYLEAQGFAADAKPAKPAKAETQVPAPSFDEATLAAIAALRAELEADGEDTSTMTDAFLAEALQREAQDADTGVDEAAAAEAMENEGAVA